MKNSARIVSTTLTLGLLGSVAALGGGCSSTQCRAESSCCTQESCGSEEARGKEGVGRSKEGVGRCNDGGGDVGNGRHYDPVSSTGGTETGDGLWAEIQLSLADGGGVMGSGGRAAPAADHDKGNGKTIPGIEANDG